MYTSLRDIMSLVHNAFILVQRLMSAEQENWESDVAESHSDYLLSVCSNSLQIYINFIK